MKTPPRALAAATTCSYRQSLIVLAIAISLTACSQKHSPEDDLEVARMSVTDQQSTSFLLLNEDKPGTPVTVAKYLVPGKYTVVGYFSAYDDACTNIEPRLLKLSQTRNDISVRIVDINRPEVQSVDWQSPIAQELQIQSLPYYEIYDTAQNLRARGRPALEQVAQWTQGIPN